MWIHSLKNSLSGLTVCLFVRKIRLESANTYTNVEIVHELKGLKTTDANSSANKWRTGKINPVGFKVEKKHFQIQISF